MPKEKSFDCIAIKRRLQRIFYEETKGMGPRELVAHIRQKVAQGPFADLWQGGGRRPTESDSKR
jgi:hypothetical protein